MKRFSSVKSEAGTEAQMLKMSNRQRNTEREYLTLNAFMHITSGVQ